VLAAIVLVGFVSGFVQGLSGFAFGLIATSLWAWMMAPQLVVPLVVMSSLLGQCVSILGVRRDISASHAGPFVLGGLVGVPIGASLLGAIDQGAFRAAVGVVLVLYCSVMLRSTRLPVVHAGRAADACVGVASGVLSGGFGIGGPPITLWCSLKDWDVRTQRATFQVFFIVLQVQTLAIYTWTGVIGREVLVTFAWLVPAIIGASWLGGRLARRFSPLQFRRVVFGLVLLSGLLLLVPAAHALLSSLAAWGR
jgi:uncharacterized membrane protein YfcA